MKSILQFLRTVSSDLDDIEGSSLNQQKNVDKVNKLFQKNQKVFSKEKVRHLKPSIKKNQIWTLKTKYVDYNGIEIKTPHPFIVLIEEEHQKYEGEDFVRVNVISPFVELASDSDLVCMDASIIGFPFLIEYWNSQPMLSYLLDEFLGVYTSLNEEEINNSGSTTIPEAESAVNKYSKEIQEFREIELVRAKYINHSVLSLISFNEHMQTEKVGIVVSLFNTIEYPKLQSDDSSHSSSFERAAKLDIQNDSYHFVYDSDLVPFKILIRKTDDGFVLTINSIDDVSLSSENSEEMDSIISDGNTIFANLGSGMYSLMTKTIEVPLKIRLR